MHTSDSAVRWLATYDLREPDVAELPSPRSYCYDVYARQHLHYSDFHHDADAREESPNGQQPTLKHQSNLFAESVGTFATVYSYGC